MHAKVVAELSQDVHQISGFNRGEFPFTYLGCPIFHARRQKLFYKDMLKKVRDKLQAWKGKLLSFGGKADLITSVLQSIPIYLLSAMVPPKCVIKELHKRMAEVNTAKNGRRCDFQRMKVELALDHCLTSPKLYLLNSGGGLEQLAESVDEVEELMIEGQWNYTKLQDLFPNDIVEHIRQELGHIVRFDGKDKSWWIETSSGKFTVKSAWDLLRQRAIISPHYEKLWIKRVSYKIEIIIPSSSSIDHVADMEEQKYTEAWWIYLI
ncbi:uncharacterized protein LOC132630776 [Lycium barbarum]|uniref:uncharacterized protein LOC132630776 n=1 Tax=Lycium barbarum TaxID=112863 RepID=UPI00293E39DF|nr:uncharacterized protein LOC132630776 [Lycium barbarum]